MGNYKIILVVFLIGTLFVSGCTPKQSDSGNVLSVAKIGIKYYGGEVVENKYLKNVRAADYLVGNHTVAGQTMVHYLIPQKVTKTPVVMIPGMGLSSYLYMSTPDGRNGWAYDFAKTGRAVYVIDSSRNQTGGIDTRLYNSVIDGDNPPESQPFMFKWSNEISYRSFGLGSEIGVPFADTQFPVENVDQLYASNQVIIGAASPDENEINNMIALLEDVGPAVLVAHSLGGVLALKVAAERPDLVKGLVMVEAIEGVKVDEKLKSVAYLGVIGDYIEQKGVAPRLEAAKTSSQIIIDNGGKAGYIYLPEKGIKGNTHVMMLDKNSSQIAKMITDWLDINVRDRK